MKKSLSYATVLLALLIVTSAGAQLTQTPSAANHIPSQVDLFAGYSYWMPNITLEGTHFSNDNKGLIVSGSYYLNRTLGLEFVGDWHLENADDSTRSLSIGPIFRRRLGLGLTPFVHTLIGAADISGPPVPSGEYGYVYLPARWGPQVTLGGGLDYPLPYFHHHLGARVQADYLYDHINYEPVAERANFNSGRFSAGVVWRLGAIAPPAPLAFSCTANPDAIFPGDPITITGVVANAAPKKAVTYSWDGEGFPVYGTNSTAEVSSASLQPGIYTVTGHAKEGEKSGESAECSARFTVKAFDPPSVSCTASPQTVATDGIAVIMAHGTSPQNRPLKYTYSASAGLIEGNDSAAKLTAVGAPTGTITVICHVTDDRGQQASAETMVIVETPPPLPTPKVQALCSIDFDRDPKRPARVNNEAKACLDEVALNAQSQPEAVLVLVGNNGETLTNASTDLAAQRARNTKEYLTKEKGIDPSRIQLREGRSNSATVNNYLVPTGAEFDRDVPGTSVLDETLLSPEGRR
jgi:outer membrane protein OmpA-like peptidoglycan-associated protein